MGGAAALFRVLDAWHIMLARGLCGPAANFAIAHELGHWLLQREGYDGDDEEAAANYLGGALLVPRVAFFAAQRACGDDLPAIAKAFGLTETCAALRLGEVARVPIAVVAPATVRVRGPENFVWGSEANVRWIARRGRPGVRKVRLTDDPRRVMLDAAAVELSG